MPVFDAVPSLHRAPRGRPSGSGDPAADGDLLGRDAELTTLATALDGDGSIAVVGEAGVGKTRLVRAALVRSGREYLEGGGFATLAWMPYLAIARAVGRPVGGDAVQAATLVERLVGPRVLFIDDLQWVDRGSRDLLLNLSGRIQLIVTIRSGAADAGDALELARHLTDTSVALEGLDDGAAAELLRQVAPDLAPSIAATVVRRAGGNPLLIEELARSRGIAGVLERGLAERRASLGEVARTELDLIAVAGRPLPASELRAVDELLASGLVRHRGDDVDIRHAMLSDAIREQLEAGRARSLHGRLATLAASDLERAAHLLEAGLAREAEQVARAASGQVDEPRERASLLGILARATGDPEDVAAAAEALSSIYDFAGVVALVDRETDMGTDAGLRAQFERARALRRLGRRDEALALVREVLAGAARGSIVAARASSQAAALMAVGLDFTGALDLLRDRRADHPAGSPEQLSLDGMAETIRMHLGETPDLTSLRASVEAAATTSPLDYVTRAYDLSKMILGVSGAAPAFEYALDAARRSKRAGYTTPSMDVLISAAHWAIFAGHYSEAVALTDEILDQPASPRARLFGHLWRMEACTYLGRFDVAAADLAQAKAIPTSDRLEEAEILIVELGLAFWSGRLGRASAIVDQLLDGAAASDLNLSVPRKFGAWLDLEFGRPVRDVMPMRLRALAGLEPEIAGVRALADDRTGDAITAFDRAAELYAGFIEPDALLCRWAGAEARRRAGDPTAIDHLRAVEAAVGDAGFWALEPRIRRSLRLAGIRSRTPRATPTEVGLSSREREVVGLVERGLSNAEIARRLGLGRPTVARMVTSAMVKVGVGRRAQLAALDLV